MLVDDIWILLRETNVLEKETAYGVEDGNQGL